MASSIDKPTMAALEADLKPKNWQESLVFSALDPKASQAVRLASKIGLGLLGGLFTVVTFGLGYFLVRNVHTTYTTYQQRINQLVKEIARVQFHHAYPLPAGQLEMPPYMRARGHLI